MRTGIRMHDEEDDDQPPRPADILTRLGVLLAIALGFGLLAQLLAGVPH